MKSTISFLFAMTFLSSLVAQDLVTNGSFEELDKKPRDLGLINYATGWYTATNAQADLFYKSGKSELNETMENKYGKEEPKTGDCYAGLVFYSYNERQPRTYISTKLAEPMKKGEWYCIKFNVSLSDLSKYGSDNLGIYVSKDSVYQEGNGILKKDPQIIHSLNRIFDQIWSWESICRIYVAKGGEEYITIGNFAEQNTVQTQQMKRPREYSVAQERVAYYYIDDVSVTEDGTRLNCKCEPGNFAFAHLEMEEKNFGSDPDEAPKTEFISSTGRKQGEAINKPVKKTIIVPFSLAKAKIEDAAKNNIDEAIAFLKENKDVKIQILGHIDATEVNLPDVAQKRMIAVEKYILSNGIDASRITTENVQDSQPLDESGEKANRYKNTVVEIVFKK